MKNYFLIFILAFAPMAVSAETFSLEVDTGFEIINAIEGEILLPQEVEIEKIYTGNSAILLWVIAPTFDDDNQKIIFSGITPGGFQGKYPILFIDSKELDLSGISFKEVKAYRNDGNGSLVPVRLSLNPWIVNEDKEPPESFKPVISSSPEIFDGKAFISFATQDKGVGVEHYEFASTWFFKPDEGKWIETYSPRVLSQLELFKRLHIKAVDGVGNRTAVSTYGPYLNPMIFIGAIMLICLLLVLRLRHSRSFLQ